MESFLHGEISTSSSRNEPRNTRPSRKTAPPKNELPAAPVVDAEIVPVTVAPAVEPIAVEVPTTATPTTETSPKPNEMNSFEQILRAIQDMVEGNRREIQDLRSELTSRKSRQEDTSRIEARLAEEERRSQV